MVLIGCERVLVLGRPCEPFLGLVTLYHRRQEFARIGFIIDGSHKGCRYKNVTVNHVAAALVAAIIVGNHGHVLHR